VNPERRSYRFGPLERRTLAGPMRTGQVLTIGSSLAAAMVLLNAAPSAPGLIAGIVVVGLATAFTSLPVGGRTADEWAPILAGYLSRMALARTRFHSPLPGVGHRRTIDGTDPKMALPVELAGVELSDLDSDGRQLGALCEQRGRRLTAVLVCRAVSFALLDPEAQERRLAQWGLLLASLPGTAIRRLQWIERTAPARGDELARWLHEARDPDLPLRGAPIVESYLELIGTSTRVTQDHEVLLAIQIDANQISGRNADLERLLTDETQRVAHALETAEIKVQGALRSSQMARALRTAYDPYSRSELAAMDAVTGRRDSTHKHEAGPLGAKEEWDHYRCDGACHATFWISGWPRVDVSPMFLDALLGSSATVRTVAVTFEPVAPERSTREVEAAITRDRADRELRRRFGQTETARHRQTQDAAARREAELAAGHTEVRLSGFVTVSGRDLTELERACGEVHQQAARARIELHRMYGQQAEAFTFTLPLARGLR
jgi:Putative type VII ESX secretion system translocon, EccE